ncbi:MAG: hypothetical protein ACKOZU_04430 [Planctomycetaceae bacterium]
MSRGRRRDVEVDDSLRRRIAAEAARGMAAGSDARRAVFRAARRLAGGWVPADRLPDVADVCADVGARLGTAPTRGDRLDRIAALAGLLATVRLDPAVHRARDALERALECFAAVHAERPYDEELLTAALVREVGLAIDRDDPVTAVLGALGDLVTPRTRWIVESVAAARAHREGTLGHRARRRLEAHEDFEAVMLLAEADRGGVMHDGAAPTLEEAIAILRMLDHEEAGGAAD